MRRTYLFLTILFVAAMVLLTLPVSEERARAQAPAPPTFQYAVKFVCGKSPTQGQPQVLATGNYFTAINVHGLNLSTRSGCGVNGYDIQFALALDDHKSFQKSWVHLHMRVDVAAIDLQCFIGLQRDIEEARNFTGLLVG